MKVEKALPKSCTGKYAKVSILTAAAKPAIVIAPKLSTKRWINKIPKFMQDCWRQVNKEYLVISERICES